MNNLESIIEMWKKDSVINEMQLDESSRDSAKLHSKYLELLSINRLKLRKYEMDMKVLLRINGYTITANLPRKKLIP